MENEVQWYECQDCGELCTCYAECDTCQSDNMLPVDPE